MTKTLVATYNADKQLTNIKTIGFKLDATSMKMLYEKVRYESTTVTIEPLDETLSGLLGVFGMVGTKIKITKVVI